MSPGLVGFFAALTVLTIFFALFGPARANRGQEYKGDGKVEKKEGIFESWIRPLVHNFMTYTPASLTENAARNEGTAAFLARAGNPWRVSPEEFAVLRVMSVAAGALLLFFASLVGYITFLPPIGAAAVGAAVGFLLPRQLLQSKWNARKKEVTRSLPEALDLMRICMNAGYNFQNALAETVELLPPGVTKDELARVSAEIRAGVSVHSSLHSFTKRIPTEGVDAFVQAVEQAQETGSDIATTLTYQSSESRAEYERIVDEKAQKLQTTLFFPIIGFFLPVLGILIFGPSLTQLTGAFG